METGGENTLRTLALRLLSERFMEEGAQIPELYVGELPEEMSFEIPLPGEVSLVGSTRRSRRRGQEIDVVLDYASGVEETREAFQSALAEAGWEKLEDVWREGGFGSGIPGNPELYCKGERGPALFLTTGEVSSGEEGSPTDVRLRVSAGEGRNSPCFWRGRRGPLREEVAIPALKPPPGAREIRMGGGGGYRGPEGASSNVALRTDLGVRRLTEHYAEQLEEADWTAVEDETPGGDENCSYKYYSFTDEEGEGWDAVLSVLRLPGELGEKKSYLLQVHAQLGGWGQ